jgi:hypothetical protein
MSIAVGAKSRTFILISRIKLFRQSFPGSRQNCRRYKHGFVIGRTKKYLSSPLEAPYNYCWVTSLRLSTDFYSPGRSDLVALWCEARCYRHHCTSPMELRAKGNKKPVHGLRRIYCFHTVPLLSQNTGLTVFTPCIILGILKLRDLNYMLRVCRIGRSRAAGVVLREWHTRFSVAAVTGVTALMIVASAVRAESPPQDGNAATLDSMGPLMPDLQYIINPGAQFPNALVGSLRLTVNF